MTADARALSPQLGHAAPGPLADLLAFELGKRSEQMHDEPAVRRGRIQVLADAV